jgi:hypothetical protein
MVACGLAGGHVGRGVLMERTARARLVLGMFLAMLPTAVHG